MVFGNGFVCVDLASSSFCLGIGVCSLMSECINWFGLVVSELEVVVVVVKGNSGSSISSRSSAPRGTVATIVASRRVAGSARAGFRLG